MSTGRITGPNSCNSRCSWQKKNNTWAAHCITLINLTERNVERREAARIALLQHIDRSRFSRTRKGGDGDLENRTDGFNSTHTPETITGGSPKSSKRFMCSVHVSQWSINFLIELGVNVPLPRGILADPRSNRFSLACQFQDIVYVNKRSGLQSNTGKLLELKLCS